MSCHDDCVVWLAVRYERGERVTLWEKLWHRPVDAADDAAVAELTCGGLPQCGPSRGPAPRCWLTMGLSGDGRRAPADGDLRAITAVEERLGPLPVALRACLMFVGDA